MNKKEIKEYLNASPLYNLSLSSKELFHSNFLYWIGKNHPELFVAIFKDLGCVASWSDDNWKIKREHLNFDICIETPDGIKFVLENKVKSIPMKRQLDEYEVKLVNKECDFVLLSLATDFPDKKAIEEKNKWKIKNYENLYVAIINNKNKFVSDSYSLALIEDYCGFIINLHNLSRYWEVKDDSPFLLRPDEDVQDLRIGDLRDKIWNSQACVKLMSELERVCQVKAFYCWNIWEIRDYGECLSKLYVNWAFTHGQGLLEVKVKINKDFVMLIQLQGNRYCHGVEWISGEKIRHADFWKKTQDNETIRSMSFLELDNEHQAIYPDICCDKKRKSKAYNKYNDTFLYQSKLISEMASVGQVLTAISGEVKKIIEIAKQG